MYDFSYNCHEIQGFLKENIKRKVKYGGSVN